MRDLCRELGHTLVVPTNCRHCARPIYLYANPDGGFAIFDRLGKPWPKHLCGLVRADTREYYSPPNTPFSPKHRVPIPDGPAAGQPVDGQSLEGTVVATEEGYAEVYDGQHLYRVVPSRPVRLGQAVRGRIRLTAGTAGLDIEDEPVPSREDLAASEKAATAAEGEFMDVERHNATTKILGRIFRKPERVVWGVFSNTRQLVAVYDYPRKDEAEAYAKLLTEERRSTFYVQSFRQLIR